jgi:hypothetical protein
MPPDKFKALVQMLTPLIMVGRKKKGPNGFIPPSIRVSAALRYFAGGSPYDIALTHGISHSAVFVSVWAVVDAINAHPKLKIEYPCCHAKQKKIAEGFKQKSSVGLDACAGCIDGMLVWTEKPSERDCKKFKCGAAKFLCGQKGKFGLNLQAVCDHKRCFLECWILNPGSSSDYISYIRSPFGKDITYNGLLAYGLALFGDNAYVNTDTMVTPYRNVRRGTKDDYNHFHSSVRICIECTFGILVHRWAILRSPLSATMGVEKQMVLVMALCKLHNYCIGLDDDDKENATTGELANSVESISTTDEDTPSSLEARDEHRISSHGGVDPRESNEAGPNELLGGGEHFDDVIVEDLPRAQGGT